MISNELFLELSSCQNVEERRLIVLKDLKSGVDRFKKVALTKPFEFFQLLGGDIENLEPTHSWAPEYTYADYIDNNTEIIFSTEDEKGWNIEKKSIENAYEKGTWYDTCSIGLEVSDGSKLYFLFDFCEGYLNECLATPYEKGNNDFTFGYLMDNS